MEKVFWQDKWVRQEIGFHQDVTNGMLEQYFHCLKLQDNDTVFVPLCGKSQDMLWIQDQGMRVLGVELSPLAVESFFNENGLKALTQTRDPFESWELGDIQLLCGDYFSLTAEMLDGVKAVFDRAAMIAMPGEMRSQYCQHMQSILPDDASLLLVTLEYPDGQMQGPPFSVGENEVRQHFSSYDVEMLATRNVLDDSDALRARGLTELLERCYLIRPK